MNKKIIYDLGSNNGDDIPYYLKKADLVIAVEANPFLCRDISTRFASEIFQKKLIVENFVLTDRCDLGEVFFYKHKKHHVLSQFPEPSDITEFEKILLPSKSVLKLISEHGDPYYIKIDLEHYDDVILRALFQNNIRPPFLSAESHSIKVFALFVALGGYKSYKLVNGSTVSSHMKHRIMTKEGEESYFFPPHSAGPFGEDICGNWMTQDSFFKKLCVEGLGWKDIHASNICEPKTDAVVRVRDYLRAALKMQIFATRKVITQKLPRILIRLLLKLRKT